MTLPFEVKTGKIGEDSITLNLSSSPLFGIPAIVGIGITSKQTKINKLAKHFEESFISNSGNNAYFRYVVCDLINKSKEKGALNVISQNRLKDIHIEGFKQFLQNSYETISMLSSYILDGAEQKIGSGTQQEGFPEGINLDDAGANSAPNISLNDPVLDAIQLRGSGVDRLSADDLRQIKTLMLQQSNQEENTDVTDVEVKEVK